MPGRPQPPDAFLVSSSRKPAQTSAQAPKRLPQRFVLLDGKGPVDPRQLNRARGFGGLRQRNLELALLLSALRADRRAEIGERSCQGAFELFTRAAR